MISETRNTEWGFFGAVSASGLDADNAWDVAIDALLDRDATPQEARTLLDSAFGRKIAEYLAGPDFNVTDAFRAVFGSDRRLLEAARRALRHAW